MDKAKITSPYEKVLFIKNRNTNNYFHWIILVMLLLLLPHYSLAEVPSYFKSYIKVSKGQPLPKKNFHFPQSTQLVDFSKYGNIETNQNGEDFYRITDFEGLRKSQTPGIYPNEADVYLHPKYGEKSKQGTLKTNHWKALKIDDTLASYFIWSNSHEPQGVKTYFQAILLEKAGLLIEALNAYQSILVHSPKSYCHSKDGSFVWYIAPQALGRIQKICRIYPDLELDYVGGKAHILKKNKETPGDIEIDWQVGKFITTKSIQPKYNLNQKKIIQTRGNGQIRLVQYENGQWQIQDNKKPFIINSVSYSPTKIGLGPKNDSFFQSRWRFEDNNQNGIIDAPFESWIDQDKDGIQNPETEPAIGDFQLLKDMGANAIRLYHKPSKDGKYLKESINKPLLRTLYKKYGIRILAGDFLGAYTIGSGASWEKGTDYTDPIQLKRMKKIVKDFVTDLKDEPFILAWVLGNENNMRSSKKGVNATRTNAADYPVAYAKFIEEVASMIHQIDPNHPVIIGNQETHLIDIYAKHAPSIDIIGVNAYRGSGFGNLWSEVKAIFDRPIIITEYGTDAYEEGFGYNGEAQKEYIQGCLQDIVFQYAGGKHVGNCVGSNLFQFIDEWWKDTHSGDSEFSHQIKPQGSFASPDGYAHEEWFGIVGQGSGKNSPFERRLRPAYYYVKSIWNIKS